METTAEVTIDGVVYQLTGWINGTWYFDNSGGEGSSSSLAGDTAGDLTVTIKEKMAKISSFTGCG